METLFRKNRVVVAVALIASLIIGAVNAVVFTSWRDNVIVPLQKEVQELRLANEVLATGACYGLVANVRIDYAWQDIETKTSDWILGPEQIQACIITLVELTAPRLGK